MHRLVEDRPTDAATVSHITKVIMTSLSTMVVRQWR